MIVQVFEVLIMTLLEMLQFLMLIISSSSHPDNCKNNFLILGENRTYGINRCFGSPEKKFDINFTKANTIFCLSLQNNADNSYLFEFTL